MYDNSPTFFLRCAQIPTLLRTPPPSGRSAQCSIALPLATLAPCPARHKKKKKKKNFSSLSFFSIVLLSQRRNSLNLFPLLEIPFPSHPTTINPHFFPDLFPFIPVAPLLRFRLASTTHSTDPFGINTSFYILPRVLTFSPLAPRPIGGDPAPLPRVAPYKECAAVSRSVPSPQGSGLLPPATKFFFVPALALLLRCQYSTQTAPHGTSAFALALRLPPHRSASLLVLASHTIHLSIPKTFRGPATPPAAPPWLRMLSIPIPPPRSLDTLLQSHPHRRTYDTASTTVL